MDDNNDYERMADEATNMLSSVLKDVTPGEIYQFNRLVEQNKMVEAWELAKEIQADKWAISLSEPPKPVVDPADEFRTDDGLIDILLGNELSEHDSL